MVKKSRKEKREERALRVCQEVRHQMSVYGGIVDNDKLFGLLSSWMNVSGKEKFEHKK